jgi:predicted transcriptional regulator
MMDELPRREREIFEIVCGAGEVTASQVRTSMADLLSRSAVRTLLARLEVRGFLTHRDDDGTYVYRPAPRTDNLRESALRHVVRTFFNDSISTAATALFGLSKRISPEELDRLQHMIDQAREREE